MHGIKPTLALTAALATLFVGCEWSGTSDSGSWSSSYDAMNFSGTYRAVTTATSSTTTTTTDSTGTANTTVTESKGGSDSFGSTSVSQRVYNGTLSHANVVPGSVAVKIGDETAFRDNAEGALVGGGVNGSGSIWYTSGTWQIAFLTAPPLNKTIEVTYKYYVDVAGAVGTMPPQAFVYGVPQPLRANAFQLDGHVFAGWSTTPDGPVAYTDGQTVANLGTEAGGTVNLYAVWMPNLNDSMKLWGEGSGP